MIIRSPLPWVLAACLVTGLTALRAQQTPPPVDPQAVLSTLKDLRVKQPGLLNRERSEILTAVKAAQATPDKAYERAMEAVEIQGPPPPPPPKGGPPKVNTRVNDARKRVEEQIRDGNFVTGLRLQLNFLNLTLQHSLGAKTKDLLPMVLEHIGQINTNRDGLQRLDMFKRSINDSIFTKHFQAGPYLNLAEWSDGPFDVPEIFQKIVLPEMRRAKDPRLINYWDNLIQAEAANATATQNNIVAARFNRIRRPSLLWGRAEDELALGLTNQAILDMLANIKANPNHPEFEQWASRLEQVTNAKMAPPTDDAAGGPSPSPSPGTGAP